MTEKRLICTRADDGIKEMCELTHPLLKAYAKQCGADFKVLDHESPCQVGDGKHHYRIMILGELLGEYDRICHIDSDIIPNKDIPNIFEVVQEDCIGSVLEDVGSRKAARRSVIAEIQNKFGIINWKSSYINTGVFVVSKKHRNIFQDINGEYWSGFGHDDAHLGFNIKKFGYRLVCLWEKYNFMTMFAEPWNGSPSRFDSYFIHYAGQGIFDPKYRTKLENMKADRKAIYG